MAELESTGRRKGPDAPLLEPGQEIAHYRVERFLARGGMGEVYRARNTKLGSDVAIKLLPARFSDDPARLALFEREARMAAHLNHPNIATVHDLFEVDDRHYLVMELVAGQSLRELLADQQPLEVPQLLDVGIQIAQALEAAHDRNIIHRDLKPRNIMITPEGRVKILDFGLAKVAEDRGSSAEHLGDSVLSGQAILGTVGYMSPEQARGKPVDGRSDLFALGVVLYELATGTAPFRRPSEADTLLAILSEQQEPISAVNPDVPAEVARFIDKLLSKDPGERPASSHAALEELEALTRSGDGGRSRWMLGVLVPLLLVAAAVAWIARPEPPAPALPPPAPEPDPRIAALIATFDREDVDVVQARESLRDLESELGADHEDLRPARLLVQQGVAATLRQRRTTLLSALRQGEWTEAEECVEAIADLDEGGESSAEASALMDRAQGRRRTVDDSREAIDRCLESGDPETAWTQITSFDEVTFEGEEFAPATRAAEEMEAKLVGHLESRLGELYGMGLEGIEPGRFKDLLDLLREVRPSHPDRVRFETRLSELRREKALERQIADNETFPEAGLERRWQVDDSQGRGIVDGLERLLESLRVLDPDDESSQTQGVVHLIDEWKRAGEAYEAFAAARLPDGPEEPVSAAREWVERYGHAAEDPAGGRAILEALGATALAPRFQGPASDLLASLEAEIETAEASAREKRLIGEVQALADVILDRTGKLLPPTEGQVRELEQLRKDEALDLKLLFASVDDAIQRVKDHERTRGQREDGFQRLRRALWSSEALPVVPPELWEGWRTERDDLNAAILFTPESDFPERATVDGDLRWRRAELNLRLHDWYAALRDIQDSGRAQTLEGRLRTGMALFGQRQLGQSIEQFEAAVLAGDESASAHYWLGTALYNEGTRNDPDPAVLSKALRHLERVIELDPDRVHAHWEAAWLYSLSEDTLSQAIRSAERSLQSVGLTEDEMIAIFGDVDPDQFVKRILHVRCGAHLVQARAHFTLERYEECITVCSAVLGIDGTLGEAYYFRGFSKAQLGHSKEDILADLDAAIEHAAGRADRDAARKLRKKIE